LGLLIMDVGGVGYVDLLMGARAPEPSAAPSPPTAPTPTAMPESAAPEPASPAAPAISSEAVVKRLVQLPLDELEALALNVLKTPEDKAWVKAAAQPSPGMPLVRQKAPIAYFVVEHVGAKEAAEALGQES
jgi:hypothetical protein